MGKTAILFGATGLIGGHVLDELLKDDRYSGITVFTRKPVAYSNKKITQHTINFTDPQQMAGQMKGDEIYCCLGTTIKKAGSQTEFRKVDFGLPVMIGEAAINAGISKLLVVSSLGADPNSSNFYLRTKGEMEQALQRLNIGSLYFFRPSMLLGERKESRPLETFGKMLMTAFSFLFVGSMSKYKAISAKDVARAMILVANGNHQKQVWESKEMAVIVK